MNGRPSRRAKIFATVDFPAHVCPRITTRRISQETATIPLMIRPDEAFWRPRIKALAITGLPHQHRMLVETKRIENFRAVVTGAGGRENWIFDDSDTYKWLEACGYVLDSAPNAELKALCDETIGLIAGAQDADGYLNTYIQLFHPEDRWARLSGSHEMYCAGHLIEAAVAWQERLGDDRLLKIALRFADLIDRRYGPGGEDAIDGHPELELALLRLADLTGDERWRTLAARQLDLRGARPSVFESEIRPTLRSGEMSRSIFFTTNAEGEHVYDGRYAQDHLPIAEQRTIEGHAVRAAYLYAAAARLLATRPDPKVEEALTALWQNTVGRRMYVTGGIGSTRSNEGFTDDFDLPNHSAYCETCASCALIFWGDEMLRHTGDSEYADVIELALFNNVLAGISPLGDRYFYANPLESRGEHERTPWFGCACCPANAARTIGRVEEWAMRTGDATAFVDFPIAGTTTIGGIELEIVGDYPTTGTWTLTVRTDRPTDFSLGIRIPGWGNDVEIDAPDGIGEAEYRSGYAVWDHRWEGETTLKIDWPMPPVWLAADPRALDDAGRLALQRGPTVYALVRADAPVPPQHLQIDPEPEVVERGGHLEVEALYEPQDQPDLLYAPYEPKDPEETTATYVPYRDWANDGATEMLVWARRL